MLIPFGIFAASGAGRIGIAGYVAGGNVNGAVATVDKFLFPADTRSTLGTGLSSSRSNIAGMANSGVAGYAAGGTSSGSTVDKFAFPADTRSTLGTGLTGNTFGLAGMANSGIAGYFGGGVSGSVISRVDKFAFPSDSKSTLGTGLGTARWGHAATGNLATAGYFVAGRDSEDNSLTNAEKFSFPGDTRSIINNALGGQGRFEISGMSNPGVAGYFAGGSNPQVFKISFPSDTNSQLGTGLSNGVTGPAAFANAAVGGYFAGGRITSIDVKITTIEKFAFPSDTRSNLGVGLSSARSSAAGFSNEGVFA
jgi:hypothetical protein